MTSNTSLSPVEVEISEREQIVTTVLMLGEQPINMELHAKSGSFYLSFNFISRVSQ